MRVIKFRLWDNLKKEMFFEGFHVFGEVTLFNAIGTYAYETKGEKTSLERYNDFLIMQYTGLKDKNGKDIYEGDILRFHYFYMSFGVNLGAQESEHELTGIVQWQEYGYGLSAIKGEHWAGYTGYSDGEGYSDFLHLAGMSESSIHEESFEIIGNIYENPELLTK